jgi:hypothetical protein
LREWGKEEVVRFDEFAFVTDPETGLSCYNVPVTPETEEITRDIREWYAERAEEFGYAGFSWEIDEVFHQRSVYLVVADAQGEVVMNCRGTHRRPGEVLPFEMALREGAPPYVLDPEEPVMDFNTFTYRPGLYEPAMPLQIAGLGRYAKLQGARRAYCLYDVRNDRIRRAYTAFGWEHAPDFPDPVFFPTYGRMEDCRFEPAHWRVLEWTEETIDRHDRMARERFVTV